jgi:hypothetical protein
VLDSAANASSDAALSSIIVQDAAADNNAGAVTSNWGNYAGQQEQPPASLPASASTSNSIHVVHHYVHMPTPNVPGQSFHIQIQQQQQPPAPAPASGILAPTESPGESAFPTRGYPPPLSTAPPFNPLQSIRNVLMNTFGGGGSRSTPPPPGEDDPYYNVVPVRPSTEKNAISTQGADLLGQVSRLRENVGRRNISGVIDESLKLASLQTVGVFVTNFLDLLLCNPVDRWNGRCDG